MALLEMQVAFSFHTAPFLIRPIESSASSGLGSGLPVNFPTVFDSGLTALARAGDPARQVVECEFEISARWTRLLLRRIEQPDRCIGKTCSAERITA
jgi:hypothetical protein